MTEIRRESEATERLHAYFDDELEPAERRAVEAELDGSPDRRAELRGLGTLRSLVAESLQADAAAVPEARFEQLWDEVERRVDRDRRLQVAAEQSATWAGTWTPRWRALRLPLVLGSAAAVAAAAVIWLALPSPAPEPMMATAPEVEPSPTADPAPSVAVDPGPTDRPDHELSLPPAKSNDADVQRIEFSGKTGRIATIPGTRGTTTVIWISEEESLDSERSL